MSTYRMAIDASICFDVDADNLEEAQHKARAFVATYDEGLAIGGCQPAQHVRAYCIEGAEPTVEDCDSDRQEHSGNP